MIKQLIFFVEAYPYWFIKMFLILACIFLIFLLWYHILKKKLYSSSFQINSFLFTISMTMLYISFFFFFFLLLRFFYMSQEVDFNDLYQALGEIKSLIDKLFLIFFFLLLFSLLLFIVNSIRFFLLKEVYKLHLYLFVKSPFYNKFIRILEKNNPYNFWARILIDPVIKYERKHKLSFNQTKPWFISAADKINNQIFKLERRIRRGYWIILWVVLEIYIRKGVISYIFLILPFYFIYNRFFSMTEEVMRQDFSYNEVIGDLYYNQKEVIYIEFSEKKKEYMKKYLERGLRWNEKGESLLWGTPENEEATYTRGLLLTKYIRIKNKMYKNRLKPQNIIEIESHEDYFVEF